MTQPDRALLVRPCGLRDVTGIRDVLKASWHPAHDHILGESQATSAGRRLYSTFQLGLWIAQSILSPRVWRMLVACRDREVIGCAMAQRDGAEIVLYLLYVHPGWQRQGVGSALLDAAIAAHPGAKAIRLEVLQGNTAAIAWYKGKGFAIYGETKNATGTLNVPAFYMDRSLEQISDHSASLGPIADEAPEQPGLK